MQSSSNANVCPACGYMMTPFEATCPRCARQSQQTTTQIPAQPNPPPAPPPHSLYMQPQPRPKSTNFFTTTAGVVTGLFTCACVMPFMCFMLFLGGCGAFLHSMGSSPESKPLIATPTPQPVARLTVDQIHAANADNQISAKALYHDKIVDISGIAEGFRSDEDLTVWIDGDHKDFNTNRIGCTFPKSAEGQLINVHKGQQITIRGRLEIDSIDSLWMRDCSLAQ